MPLVPWPVHRIFMGSASFMQEIELFLSRPGDGRRMPRIGMTTVLHGLRDGVSRTLACIGLSASSVRLVGSAGAGPSSEEKERQLGGSSHCPSGIVSHTYIHRAQVQM